ncbi:MAG: hypothetical protein AB1489_25485, partial [Acidobacteriota bacterium]
LATILLIIIPSLLSQKIVTSTTANALRQQQASSELAVELTDNAYLRAQHFYKQRAFPFENIPNDWRIKAINHVREEITLQSKIRSQVLEPLQPIGPAPITDGRTFVTRQNLSGRITALAIDPQNPAIIYLGTAQGGLWRSTNAGQNWQPMTDNAPTLAIGAVAIDPTNRNTIYIGTGEGNLSGDSFGGMGILKSTDAGETWINLAMKRFAGCSFAGLVIDPNNTNTLYAAINLRFRGPMVTDSVSSGIYKSTDGGVNWRAVLQMGLPPFFSAATDIEMDLSNPSVLYATIRGQGVFKTKNGGRSWIKLAGGLPTSSFDRPDIGVSRSNPKVLYAAFGDRRTGDLLNIFKSTNAGKSWKIVAQPPPTIFGNICQCFYDNVISIDPTNADVVYYGGVGLYKSVNGGKSWRDLSASDIGLHEDFHAIAFVPGNANQLFVGNDGGIWSSPDAGNTWVNLNNDLSLTQFESVTIHPTDAKIGFGGSQDNGTIQFTGDSWQQVEAADGGVVAIDQSNPDIVYHLFQSPLLRGPVRSNQGGKPGTFVRATTGIDQSDGALFYAPFILDVNNPSTLYYGTLRLYRSTNQGRNWTAITSQLASSGLISAIAVAPSTPKVIYTAYSNGAIFASTNGGTTFENVTGDLPMRFISDIAVDPNRPSTVYVTLSGFLSGHVFKSTSGGSKWKNISSNLPDVPANTLVINAVNPQQLFLGNDIGLFQSDDGGNIWTLVPGMPFVSVFDIAINERLGILRAATHGRGMYELKLATTLTKNKGSSLIR